MEDSLDGHDICRVLEIDWESMSQELWIDQLQFKFEYICSIDDVMKWVKKLEKGIKCDLSECSKNAEYWNEEEQSTICLDHYSDLSYEEVMQSDYTLFEDKIKEIQATINAFNIDLFKINATKALFTLNQQSLEVIKNEIKEIEDQFKNFNMFSISLNHLKNSFLEGNSENIIKIMTEFNKAKNQYKNILNIIKQSSLSLFLQNLLDKLHENIIQLLSNEPQSDFISKPTKIEMTFKIISKPPPPIKIIQEIKLEENIYPACPLSKIDQLEVTLNNLKCDYNDLNIQVSKYQNISVLKSSLDLLCADQKYREKVCKTILRKACKLSSSQLSNIYKMYSSEEMIILNEIHINIDCSKEKQMEMLRIFLQYQLPDIGLISLDFFSDADTAIVNEFLEYSFPEKLEYFNFCPNSIYNLQSSALYLSSLSSCVQAVMKEFFISKVEFTKSDFESLLFELKHVAKPTFYKCILLTDSECDFSKITSSNIKCISFLRTGSQCYSDWSVHPFRFKNILKGITGCLPLKSNIKDIEITLCDLEMEESKEYMKEFDLCHINLIF